MHFMSNTMSLNKYFFLFLLLQYCAAQFQGHQLWRIERLDKFGKRYLYEIIPNKELVVWRHEDEVLFLHVPPWHIDSLPVYLHRMKSRRLVVTHNIQSLLDETKFYWKENGRLDLLAYGKPLVPAIDNAITQSLEERPPVAYEHHKY